MGITDLDPLDHGLIFERFLNPERISMPDIDIDFDERGRADVIRYVTGKWGSDKVAQIITYGTIKAKAAIKDSTRVLGFPYALGDRITKAFPPAVMGKDIPLSGIFDEEHPRYKEAGELRALYEGEAEIKQVIDTAKGIEGLIRQPGVHAAGVIMSAEPLTDHIPVWTRNSDGAVITQFDYPTCEGLGLLKMDFLGLRNLTIMSDAVEAIEQNRGIKIDLLSLKLDDKPTYDLLARGDTLGVFQFDGGPMRSLLRLMKPDNFEDISAVGALYRPGPMGVNSHTNYALRKNGQQEIVPIHPELEEPLREILEPTFGLIVYQEQVQKAAQIMAGYTLGQADLLRRAMGKKKKEILDKEFVPFRQGCREHGYSDQAIQAVWDVLVPFAGYAFNKAHSAAYGLVSYWTAYLKANYPAEYMAALLTSVGDDKDKSALYLSESRRMGVKVLPPDVNASVATFTAVGNDVRFGLAAIRNVGANVVDAIIAARKSKGDFTSFADFLRKVPAVVCNKRVIESLVKAGAFDSFGHPRKGLVLIHEQAVDSVIDIKRNEAIGQDSLFGGDAEAEAVFEVAIPDAEWDKKTRLNFEREMLGLYVSDHPLLGVEHMLAKDTDCSLAELMSASEDEDRPRSRARRAQRGPDRQDRRHPVRRAAQGDQAGQPVGGGHPRGPRRRDRGAVLPADLPALRDRDRRGRDRDRQGPGRPPRRRPEAHRHGHDRPRPHRRRRRPVRGEPAGDPLRASGGRAAPRGAAHPPRPDRGPPQAARQPEDDGGPPRRQAPRHRLAGPARRPQAAPRPELHRQLERSKPELSRTAGGVSPTPGNWLRRVAGLPRFGGGAEIAPDLPQGADQRRALAGAEGGQRPLGELTGLLVDVLLQLPAAVGEAQPDQAPVARVRLAPQQPGGLHTGGRPRYGGRGQAEPPGDLAGGQPVFPPQAAQHVLLPLVHAVPGERRR